jgi:biotin synthase-like enzyme
VRRLRLILNPISKISIKPEGAARIVSTRIYLKYILLIDSLGSYCSQSSRYSTPTTASRLVDIEPVLEAARKAKENGSTRFCMGAAWRDLAGRKRGFEKILQMVSEVRGMGMEVCTTLGMLSPEQARRLKEAYVRLTIYTSDILTSPQRFDGL